MMNLQINQELRDLIPPLTPEEYSNLENSIKKEGCRDSIILWNGIIIDGHNRYEICSKHNIGFNTTNKEFQNIEEVKLWMIDNQHGRRNLTDGWKWELSQVKRELLLKQGKENMSKGLSQNDKPLNTREQIASKLDWSLGKVAIAEQVWKKADEPTKDLVKKGEKTFNEVYTQIKKEEHKKQILKEMNETINKQKQTIEGYRKLKVLNLYAGIGGNRKLWENVEVTAVENNPEIAKIYQDFFPNDKVIVGDAVKYLEEHYKDFDFIWASPPCPTHSRMRLLCNVQEGKKAKIPDMTLYGLIIFLKTFYKGLWVVENVISYYEPLIEPYKVANHYFWSNFNIEPLKDVPRGILRTDIDYIEDNVSFNLDKYNLNSIDKRHYLNNCVKPEVGLYVFNSRLNGEG